MDDLTGLITHLAEILPTYSNTQRFWVAYSGGLDSHVLLYALAQLRSQLPNLQLHAIHIHHGLRPKAVQWAEHCRDVCNTLTIPCKIVHVQVRIATRESIEANARTARYQAIAQLLAPNDVVLTAQHADDQAETVLLQLLRGAGVAGLAAMPSVTRLGPGWLVRPLLNYTRAQLSGYAQQAHLQWIEDDSNTDIQFDRNFLRQRIIPRLQQRWPSLSQTLSRAAAHQAQANELVNNLAQLDWENCRGNQLDQLNLPALATLSPARQRQVVRYWLKKCHLPLPSTVQLQHILSDLPSARTDRQPMVRWQGAEIHRYRQTLFAMPNLPPLPINASHFNWLLPQTLLLPLGRIHAYFGYGRGMALPAGTLLQVRFRQGGERFRWQGHQRVVKKLLQAIHLPPWQRPFIPLIYFNNTLIAIPGIGIRDEFRALTGEPGWEIQWQL